jgi:DNA polymerase-4
MVDDSLPFEREDNRPLRVLFLDLNAYFASCEQQENPDLRGRPIIVAPVETDSTCAIAASYEAKRYGIRTGTNVGDARRMCPDLVVVPARPPVYVRFHHAIIEAAESVLPVDKVSSIDEMRFRLLGRERDPGQARELAHRMKRTIREQVGEVMTCSVGIAPNAFLAKLASDMQKPDGLVILQRDDLPGRVQHLALTEIAGINVRMKARLNGAGIFDVGDLFATSRQELRAAFGSVIGERWWYLLRGYELDEQEAPPKTLSHSHVLPPDLRTDQGCREVLLRLIQKATARLRANELCASFMSVHVRGFDRSWKAHTRLDATNDTVTVNDEFLRLWAGRDFDRPRQVGVGFADLSPAKNVTPSLFDDSGQRDLLDRAVDTVNRKFGKNSIFLAGMEGARDTASEKIAFNKTWLFSEGKGDNEVDA